VGLLEARGLCVTFGGVRANDQVDIAIDAGAFVGLIGPNGAGKTTFIDAVTGFVTSSAGTVVFDGDDITRLSPTERACGGLTRTFQSLELFEDLSVLDNLLVAAERPALTSFLADLVRPRRLTTAVEQAQWALEFVGLESFAHRLPSELSNGQRKLVGVARAVAARPKLVLLDEPAAGLDTAESQALGHQLRRLPDEGIAVLLVDHDMGLVLSVCDDLYVLDFGRIIARGTPSEIRGNSDVITAYLGETVGDSEMLEDEVTATLGHDLPSNGRAAATAGPAGGGGARAVTVIERDGTRPLEPREKLIEVAGLAAGYDGVAVVRDVDLEIRAGEVVALLGPNGAGKTTTLLTISGILSPLAGTVTVLGKAVRRGRAHAVGKRGLAHVAEDRSLFYGLTVQENLRLALTGPVDRRKRAYARAISLFPALKPLMDHKAGLLSGGEQQMLAMARAVVSEPKVLLVDEMSLGLAPIIVERLLPVVRDIAELTGAGVLLVEQHVHMALKVADRAYVMNNGRIVISGPADELRQRRDLLEVSYLGEAALS
jgi:ABC-type branched-subunit amino acid transport system ATPase component